MSPWHACVSLQSHPATNVEIPNQHTPNIIQITSDRQYHRRLPKLLSQFRPDKIKLKTIKRHPVLQQVGDVSPFESQQTPPVACAALPSPEPPLDLTEATFAESVSAYVAMARTELSTPHMEK